MIIYHTQFAQKWLSLCDVYLVTTVSALRDLLTLVFRLLFLSSQNNLTWFTRYSACILKIRWEIFPIVNCGQSFVARIEHVLIVKAYFERRKIAKVFMTRMQDSFRMSLSTAAFGRKLSNVSLPLDIHRVTVTWFLHISCFPPFCGASSAKCLLFWRQ